MVNKKLVVDKLLFYVLGNRGIKFIALTCIYQNILTIKYMHGLLQDKGTISCVLSECKSTSKMSKYLSQLN